MSKKINLSHMNSVQIFLSFSEEELLESDTYSIKNPFLDSNSDDETIKNEEDVPRIF